MRKELDKCKDEIVKNLAFDHIFPKIKGTGYGDHDFVIFVYWSMVNKIVVVKMHLFGRSVLFSLCACVRDVIYTQDKRSMSSFFHSSSNAT